MASGHLTYIGAWLDGDALRRVIARACVAAGVTTQILPDGVRIRDCGDERFWFNYNSTSVEIAGLTLPSAGVYRQTQSGIA